MQSRFCVFFSFIALLLLLQSNLFGQSFSQALNKAPLYPGELLQFTVEPDSAKTVFTPAFGLREYDSFFWGIGGAASENRRPFKVRYKATSAAGSPNVSVYVQGNFSADSTDSGWADVDTVAQNITGETAVTIDLDLNNKKFPYFRYRIVSEDTGRKDQSLDYDQYLYQDDQN